MHSTLIMKSWTIQEICVLNLKRFIIKGTRPLDKNEILLVSACFDGMFEIRNRGLFMIGVSTGGRISELLSLRIGDVYQNG